MNEEHHAEESRNGVARSLAGLISTLCETLGRLVTGKKANVDLCTREDLEQMERNIIMAVSKAISDFSVAQNAFMDRLNASLTGLQGDVANLNDQITKLQNSPGAISPEDQALLDGIQSRASSIATALEAVDAITPPPVPVA